MHHTIDVGGYLVPTSRWHYEITAHQSWLGGISSFLFLDCPDATSRRFCYVLHFSALFPSLNIFQLYQPTMVGTTANTGRKSGIEPMTLARAAAHAKVRNDAHPIPNEVEDAGGAG